MTRPKLSASFSTRSYSALTSSSARKRSTRFFELAGPLARDDLDGRGPRADGLVHDLAQRAVDVRAAVVEVVQVELQARGQRGAPLRRGPRRRGPNAPPLRAREPRPPRRRRSASPTAERPLVAPEHPGERRVLAELGERVEHAWRVGRALDVDVEDVLPRAADLGRDSSFARLRWRSAKAPMQR